MKPQPELKSEELLLRAFSLEDASAVQALAGDRRVSDTTENIPHPYHDGLAESWISTHKGRWEKGEGVTYAVTLRKPNILIGAVGLMKIVNFEAALGYWIGFPYWKNGYCTTAVKLLVDFSFSSLKISRIYAKHLTKNPASGRVLEKAGFSHVGSTYEKRWKNEGLVAIEKYEKHNT